MDARKLLVAEEGLFRCWVCLGDGDAGVAAERTRTELLESKARIRRPDVERGEMVIEEAVVTVMPVVVIGGDGGAAAFLGLYMEGTTGLGDVTTEPVRRREP